MKLLLFLGLLLPLLLTLSQAVVIRVENLPEKCDYSKCTSPDPSKINVHLVPHTHDDVGWLKTVDQYFYGTSNEYQKVGVQYIIDSVVEELIRNKERRFIYVEVAFFWMWWLEQTEEQRVIVQELVKTGQLEFINGGWSMNDEAVCHYNSIIDQMSWGHRKLHDTFGKCGVPKVAWQIDPFGHSREQTNLFAGMNYDALFFAREDYQDQQNRRHTKTLEHVWQGSDDLGTAGDLFTGMMDMGYVVPRGFNWDLLAMNEADEPVVDNKDSEEYNVPRIVDKLVNLAKDYVKNYATNNIMVPMGMDFHYQDAHVYFKNMDKLIKHVNELSKEVKIFYSTPSCYAKALHATNRTWTSKTDDYFPYASDPHQYWTGYYTSRPTLKRFERIGNNLLQACKQIDVLAGNDGKYEAQISALREMMGVMQHHDAVTGTEKQHVANNYAKHLDIAVHKCFDVIQTSLQSKLLPKTKEPTTLPTVKQEFCQQLNISSCPVTEAGKDFTVNIYNPLGHSVQGKQIRLPVDGAKHYTVTGPTGEQVQAWLVPISEFVQKIAGRETKSTLELVFRADLPALGLVSYFVQASATRSANSATEAKMSKISKETILKTKNFEVTFDLTGHLSQVKLQDGRKVALKAEFLSYSGGSSGAYMFRPDSKAGTFAKITESNLFSEESTDHKSGVCEIHQKFDSHVNQIVRVDPSSDVIEFDWVVGPLGGWETQEIVTRFSTDLKNNQTFYTDANGRQMLKRVWDYRQSWKYEMNEPISGNYYPVTSRIFLRDEKQNLQFTVLNDRAQGGTSPSDGALELMVHRRTSSDDNYGVGEALREPGYDGNGLIVSGKHVLVLDSIVNSAAKHRELAQQLFMEPVISFTTGLTEVEYRKHFQTLISGLTTELPRNVHLLTLEQWANGQLLLRLEHFYQNGEDAELSKPATINLKNLFKQFEIVEAKELTLSGNADISESKNRLKFNYKPLGKVEQTVEGKFDSIKLELTINPMQIRTFAIKIKRN